MSAGRIHYPWFKREDVDGFFALFQNNLANFALLAIWMLGMGFPGSLVFGKVIPGAAVAVAAGNFYYAFMAKRLAEKEGRSNVTALSYGISTPVQFVYVFGIIAPALAITGDHELAWKVGVGACLLGGIIEMIGGFIGPWLQRNLPRAAMMGALAGVAFAFVGGEMFFKTFAMPMAGTVVLAIIFAGLIAKVVMPGKLPTSLLAIALGTAIAYLFGAADPGTISAAADTFGFYPPLPTLVGFEGLGQLFGVHTALLAVILPISIYNFIETMNNVEAMKAAGDSYDVRETQFADGAGTVLGALFGGVLPTTVYIASVGSKQMNAGRGYSVLNGVVYLLAASVGLIGAISQVIPLAVIAPILVFVGISMVSTAFTTSPSRHAPAVVIAMIPYLANFLMSRFNSAAPEAVANISSAVVPLGQGAMFTALLWGALGVFFIDRQWKKAMVAAVTMAVLAAVGLIHAPRLAFMFETAREFVWGYVALTVLCGVFGLLEKGQAKPVEAGDTAAD